MSKYKIVPVPPKMEKFYGCGTMLHPTLEQVASLVNDIPVGEVRTIQAICDQLAMDARSNVTCPMRTGNAIKKMSKTAASHDIPFWRVVRTDGFMIKIDNLEIWTARLQEEGAEITYSKNGNIKVSLV